MYCFQNPAILANLWPVGMVNLPATLADQGLLSTKSSRFSADQQKLGISGGPLALFYEFAKLIQLLADFSLHSSLFDLLRICFVAR